MHWQRKSFLRPFHRMYPCFLGSLLLIRCECISVVHLCPSVSQYVTLSRLVRPQRCIRISSILDGFVIAVLHATSLVPSLPLRDAGWHGATMTKRTFSKTLQKLHLLTFSKQVKHSSVPGLPLHAWLQGEWRTPQEHRMARKAKKVLKTATAPPLKFPAQQGRLLLWCSSVCCVGGEEQVCFAVV